MCATDRLARQKYFLKVQKVGVIGVSIPKVILNQVRLDQRKRINQLILLVKIRLAERGGFEPSPSALQKADSQGELLKLPASASLVASQNPVNPCPELAELFRSWPKLPAKVRQAFLALIHASLNSTTK
jgi:hypothetical protein